MTDGNPITKIVGYPQPHRISTNEIFTTRARHSMKWATMPERWYFSFEESVRRMFRGGLTVRQIAKRKGANRHDIEAIIAIIAKEGT